MKKLKFQEVMKMAQKVTEARVQTQVHLTPTHAYINPQCNTIGIKLLSSFFLFDSQPKTSFIHSLNIYGVPTVLRRPGS